MRNTTLSLCSALLMTAAGCGVPFGEFEVLSDNVYQETEPNDDSAQPEDFGVTIDGATWHEIRGTFDSVNDVDHFRVDIGGMSSVDLVTWREYRDEEQQYNLAFPLNVNEYSEDGTLGMQNLLAAWSWGVDFEAEASYVVLKVYGQSEDDAGVDSYRDDRPYRIQFR